MELAVAKAEFSVRYYRWALDDWRRELAEDFRFLRSVKGRTALRFLAYVERLSLDEQLAVAAALVKHYHPEAVNLTGEYLDTDEKRLVERVHEACLLASDVEVKFSEQLLAGRTPPRLNRSRLSTLLKREVKAAFGQVPTKGEGPTLLNTTTIGEWLLRTEVGQGSPPFYVHQLWAKEHVWLRDSISVLSWLGLDRTYWDLARGGDEETVAGAIGTACSHFLKVVPDLLSGLSHDVLVGKEPVASPPAYSLAPRLGSKRES